MSGLEQSAILTPREVELIKAFTNGTGKAARARGFANLMESPVGVTSVVLGFMDDLDRPIPLGTLYVVTKDEGGCDCSVCGIDNSPVTQHDAYPDVTSALIAAQPYFQHMAANVGRAARPTLLSRLRGIVGL